MEAVLRYTKALVHHLASYNVNAICPSMVWPPTSRGQVEDVIRSESELAKRDPHDVYIEVRRNEISLGREQATEDARNVT